jgi:hypothetical protein
MTPVPCVEIPTGTLPPIRDFIRHVWRYRDENGETVLTAPPGDVMTLVIDDPNEADICITLVTCLTNTLGFEHRITSSFNGPNVCIAFRDLHAIYAFLQVISMHTDRLAAIEVASYCLSQLGFRWK